MNPSEARVLGARVRTSFGVLLIGSFALAMMLMIWQVAYDENPLANVMASALYQTP